jgi:hypothetical protein
VENLSETVGNAPAVSIGHDLPLYPPGAYWRLPSLQSTPTGSRVASH